MGNLSTAVKNKGSQFQFFIFFIVMKRSDCRYHNCIGKGGFGKVWKISNQDKYFAMKEMSKARVISKRSVKSVINERLILA